MPHCAPDANRLSKEEAPEQDGSTLCEFRLKRFAGAFARVVLYPSAQVQRSHSFRGNFPISRSILKTLLILSSSEP
jgi:hypothetical protein